MVILLAIMPFLQLTRYAHAQVTLNREDAFNSPSRHAWNLFLLLNHPAKDVSLGRGLPDLTKSIGAPGTSVVWETWRLAETEVFLPKGTEPPDWNDLKLAGSPLMGKVPQPVETRIVDAINRDRTLPRFDPNDGVFAGTGGFGESRMNQATYEFIKRNKLYSIEGQQRYAQDVIDEKKPPISFTPDSMEAKAAWIKFTKDEIAAGKHKRYYVATYQDETYGLVSLHFITKDLPNWFWCTFHHVDNPPNSIGEKPDNFTAPKVLENTVWQNYKLGGTQTDFVTQTGSPTILSDAYIEFGFTRSSCITCHSHAAIGAGNDQSFALFPLGAPRNAVGIPELEMLDILIRQKRFVVVQKDFLFSLSRAKSEKD
jgi:hypothetical protein